MVWVSSYWTGICRELREEDSRQKDEGMEKNDMWLIGEWSNLVLCRERYRDNWKTKKEVNMWKKMLHLLTRKSGEMQ